MDIWRLVSLYLVSMGYMEIGLLISSLRVGRTGLVTLSQLPPGRVKEELHLCMQALYMQVIMVTYNRERDPQFSCFFPTNMLPW